MWHKIIFILAIIACNRLHARRSTTTASFGNNFTILFPPVHQYRNEYLNISVTLMNPNSKQVSVQIKYAEDGYPPENFQTITVIVQPLNYETVQFNKSVINICDTSDFENLVECSDSRIYISSANLPISVISHWYLPNAGDSFLVLPSSMASNKYAFSAPEPAEDGRTIIYFLPISDDTRVNVTGEIGDMVYCKSFKAKLDNGDLVTIQTKGKLALIASANVPFTVIVVVEGLPVSSDNNRTDFGAYMPTPLLDSVSDCYNVNDYHISTLFDMKIFMVTTDNSICDLQFTVFDEEENSMFYSLTDLYNELSFDEYSKTAGFNSSSTMLQVLRYGGYENELINGSFLDLAVSWSQFVTGLTTFIVPSGENIVIIIGDTEATVSTTIGNKLSFESIWNWSPIYFYQQIFYYSTMSLPNGFYVLASNGSYTVLVTGQKNDAAYGFVTAYNAQISKALPEIKTTVQPRITTTISSSTDTTETVTTTTTYTTEMVTTTTTITATSEEAIKGSVKILYNLGLLLLIILFCLSH